MKCCLKKTLGKTFLDFYEFQTVLSQINLFFNSRPLGILFDNDLMQILKFVVWVELNLVNDSRHSREEIDILKHYNFVESLLDHLRERWSTKYIPSLANFQKLNINSVLLYRKMVIV